MWRTDANRVVAALNTIFEEERVGYELTEKQQIDTGEPAMFLGRKTGFNAFRTVYPQIIRKDQHDTHVIAVKPALAVLSDPRFATANGELLKSFEHVQDETIQKPSLGAAPPSRAS